MPLLALSIATSPDGARHSVAKNDFCVLRGEWFFLRNNDNDDPELKAWMN